MTIRLAYLAILILGVVLTAGCAEDPGYFADTKFAAPPNVLLNPFPRSAFRAPNYIPLTSTTPIPARRVPMTKMLLELADPDFDPPSDRDVVLPAGTRFRLLGIRIDSSAMVGNLYYPHLVVETGPFTGNGISGVVNIYETSAFDPPLPTLIGEIIEAEYAKHPEADPWLLNDIRRALAEKPIPAVPTSQPAKEMSQ